MDFFIDVWEILKNNWLFLLISAGTTIVLSIIGTTIGFCIGLLTGTVKTIPVSKKDSVFKRFIVKFVNVIISIYVEIFRGTPMIVQSMVIFYGAALLFNLHMNIFVAGLFIVSINTGAYMTEIVRGGIISVDKGQFEAAHAIGMSHWKTMRCVVMPQVIRNILPATGNEFVINIKDTSVLSVIGVTELYFQSNSIAGNNFKYFQTFFITCIMYLILTFSITRLLKFFEKKLDGPQNYQIYLSDVNTLNTTQKGESINE